LNSKYSALTLASFTILVPFQPFGVFNVNYISPLLLPAALVGIVGVVIILAFMIAVNKKRKKSAP
jgi:CHASE1-domain containing sensor protein